LGCEEVKKFIEALEKNPNEKVTFDKKLLIAMLKLMIKGE